MDTVRAELDVPILIPAHDYGDFCSGIIRLGNLDIEFLKLGTENISEPYFYGIAFASAEGIWNTASWLKTLQIRHTLPIHTTVMRDGKQWGWSTILVDGFLDNPIPAPYSLGTLLGDRLMARGASAFSTTLMKVPVIRRSMSSKGGGSMCFICHYDQDLSLLRSEATATLATSGGGKKQISEVGAIVIEADRTITAWEQILMTERIDNPRLDIQRGATNRIREVVIKTKSSFPIPSVHFGDATFSFQAE
ncbi:MAG: hypothetical protein HC930_17820 [Hydrococcus sp. SU_1_0]|nr:hypothetical protein [Hydrococcus sp. SU_1_0]NJO95029.1 hypothetical protein [Pleurocapsa sp. CRU_1_2]